MTDERPVAGERPVAVITGAASGIGRATARRFVSGGWAVLAGDLNPEGGESLLAELAREHPQARAAFERVDVSQETDVEVAVARASREFGRLDCVVNNRPPAGSPSSGAASTLRRPRPPGRARARAPRRASGQLGARE